MPNNPENTAYIGLGSNLEQPQRQIEQAIEALRRIPDTALLHTSRLYRSAPMGPQDQPDYLNAAAALATRLAPLQLLEALQAIENAQGRLRTQRWGPRTVDLDLLLYGETVLESERLTLPHPGIRDRCFVLVPLAEIAPGLRMPDGASVTELAGGCDLTAV